MKKPRIRICWYSEIYTLELIEHEGGSFGLAKRLHWPQNVILYGFIESPCDLTYLAFGKYFCDSLRFA